MNALSAMFAPWVERRLARWSRVSAVVLGAMSTSACSILSPVPLWELAKATGQVSTMAIGSAPGTPSNTVYHEHAPVTELCIEYNPESQVPDVLPALQSALKEHQIESRVYAGRLILPQCPVWLRYTAYLQWEKAPFSDDYRSYVSSAALTLQAASGKILSSSSYELDNHPFGSSKWASTRRKLAPVVAALVTGIEN